MSLLRMFAFRPDEDGGSAAASGAAPGASAGVPGADTSARPARAAQGGVRTRRAFDGDWPGLAKSLNVSGMAKQLAQQSELKSFDGDAMELCVPIAMKHLAEKPYQDKLKAALQEYFGRPIRFGVRIGGTTGNTAQDQAVASIQQDAFVRDMVENLDATIVTSSIKPVQSAAESRDDQ